MLLRERPAHALSLVRSNVSADKRRAIARPLNPRVRPCGAFGLCARLLQVLVARRIVCDSSGIMFWRWAQVAVVCVACDGGGNPDLPSISTGNEICEYAWEPAPENYQVVQAQQACGRGPFDALPSGNCNQESFCQTVHTRECGGRRLSPSTSPTRTSPLDAWICHCGDGRWSCWVQWPAASICPLDGGFEPSAYGANCAPYIE